MTWRVDSALLEPGSQVAPAEPLEAMAQELRQFALALTPGAASRAGRFVTAMAQVATVLWSGFHRFDSADPHWPDRDRFVLSPAFGAPLLHALLHFTGHDMHAHPAIEAATGSLGQGLGMAVGMALAERLLAARFGKSLVDHRTWVFVSPGDLAQGVSHEAAGLAGQLRLEKLCVLLADPADPEGGEGLPTLDDTLRRFAALGWSTRNVPVQDASAIEAALVLSARARRPTLIACRTGKTLQQRVPGALSQSAALWAEAGRRGSTARRVWLKRLAHHPLRAEFDRVMAGRLPEGWTERLAGVKINLATMRAPASTRDWADQWLDALAPDIPELVGGQTELGRRRHSVVAAGSFSRRQVHFGPREHGMAACLNGLALHRGLLPYAVAPLAATDGMRPALRLSALMGVRAVYIATHDSIGCDGAAFQPVEQLAGLRAIPNLLVLRPADAVETAECCELAMRRTAGPCLLVLSEQPVPALRSDIAENRSARGAYVLAEAHGPRAATLIASGSEVSLALAARERLIGEGIAAAVVSMPAWSLFAATDAANQAWVLGRAPRFGIEAAGSFGWERWLENSGVFIGLCGFGPSNLTPEAIAATVGRHVS